MTDKTNQCAEHPWCKARIEEVETRLSDFVEPAIVRIKEIQQSQDSQFALYVPKSWIWWGLCMLSPIYAFVFGLSVYLATTDARFADKQSVLNHEYRITTIERSLEQQNQSMKEILCLQNEILKRLPK